MTEMLKGQVAAQGMEQASGMSVSHHRTPSRELMTHTMTLLTRVRVRRKSLDQSHRARTPDQQTPAV